MNPVLLCPVKDHFFGDLMFEGNCFTQFWDGVICVSGRYMFWRFSKQLFKKLMVQTLLNSDQELLFRRA